MAWTGDQESLPAIFDVPLLFYLHTKCKTMQKTYYNTFRTLNFLSKFHKNKNDAYGMRVSMLSNDQEEFVWGWNISFMQRFLNKESIEYVKNISTML